MIEDLRIKALRKASNANLHLYAANDGTRAARAVGDHLQQMVTQVMDTLQRREA